MAPNIERSAYCVRRLTNPSITEVALDIAIFRQILVSAAFQLERTKASVPAAEWTKTERDALKAIRDLQFDDRELM